MSHRLLAHIDWLPTLVGRARGSLSQPLPLDGVDQWTAITDAAAPAARTELLHNFDLSTKLVKDFVGALRVGELKLVRQAVGGVADDNGDVDCEAAAAADTEDARDGAKHVDTLYNMTADPAEAHDLAADPAFATALASLQARLDELGKQTVPCWCDLSSAEPGKCAGTGYMGNCETNKPQCTTSTGTVDHYGPGWCPAAAPLPPPTNCTAACAFESDVHYPCGSSCDLVKGVTVASKEKCCALCGNTAGCAKFVFNHKSAKCTLKSAPFGAAVPSEGTMSGGCA